MLDPAAATGASQVGSCRRIDHEMLHTVRTEELRRSEDAIPVAVHLAPTA
jgi:hypothetical protein